MAEFLLGYTPSSAPPLLEQDDEADEQRTVETRLKTTVLSTHIKL